MCAKMSFWRLCVLGLLLAPGIKLESRAAVSVRDAAENNNETINWLKKVADWQLTQSSWDKSVSWERGALHAGLMACYEATKDERYLASCRQWSEKFNWKLAWDSHHADNMACAQTYLELYLLDEPDPFRYADYKAQNDDLVAAPASFACNLAGGNETWWWCDALFMAPPAMTRMSRILQNDSYTQTMHTMWSDTQSCLYDADEQLFYRDINYLPPYNYNGQKVFWSRGNGWVIAGAARVLQYLPATDPERVNYITLLQNMSQRLAAIQLADGYWHSDLLSPERYDNPETSGTGFFTFGMAWGVNNGYLPEAQYWDNVQAGWDALRAAVQPDGLLGWVQPVGADPRVTTATDTDVFGVGAYLLAGSEIYKYELAHNPGTITCFEEYADTNSLRASWPDSLSNGTRANISLGDYADNFMQLEYDNDEYPYYAEVRQSFSEGRDFTVNNAHYLSILVRGESGNTPEQIYVRLTDNNGNSTVATLSDTTVVQTPHWQELGFPLTDFAGIDLRAVTRLDLGIGSAESPAMGGAGIIRVDNIRLLPVDQIESASDLVADYKIDLQDFSQLAQNWLLFYGNNIDPIDPGESSLTAHWSMDNSFTDQSGNGYDALAGSAVTFAEGHTGESANFSGTDYSSYLNCQNSSDLHFTEGLTISAWIKSSGQEDLWASIITKGLQAWRLIRNNSGNSLSFHFNKAGGGEYQANGTIAVMDGQWHHVMAVYDGKSLSLYIDGELDTSVAAGAVNSSNDPVYIGSRVNNTHNRNWTGNIDDVRLYNTALSVNNLLYLAEKPGFVELPEVILAEDLKADGIIDTSDLDELIENWASEMIWP